MEGSSNSPEYDITGGLAGKFPELLSELEGELWPEIPIKEELIEEVMQELYKEITCSTTTRRTNDSSVLEPTFPPLSSSPSPLLSPSSSLYVVEGKNGSCGASVSDLASTVMAGIEFVGLPEKGSGVVEKGLGVGEGLGWRMDTCDGGDQVDEEWLARVLSWGPLELEEWT